MFRITQASQRTLKTLWNGHAVMEILSGLLRSIRQLHPPAHNLCLVDKPSPKDPLGGMLSSASHPAQTLTSMIIDTKPEVVPWI